MWWLLVGQKMLMEEDLQILFGEVNISGIDPNVHSELTLHY